MKKWFLPLVMGALLILSSMPAQAAAEKTFLYDTSVRFIFGFGQGKKSVRDEDFGKFLADVVTPTFQDGYTTFDSRGQWLHPSRGVIKERNAIVLLDVQNGEEADAKIQKVVDDYLRRFPNCNAAVYVVKQSGTSAKIYF